MPEATYAEARDRLRLGLSDLADLADERERPELAEGARALDKKLVENRFNVVVVGEFKRGKTTFVNALLGRPVLPVAVVPLTSIVTAVTWGETARAQIHFSDGRVEEVPSEQLERFVTERGNPDNERAVARAELAFPAEDLRDGVYLVDTPGVGSVYRHNTDAARDFVPEADVAIFLTSADPPISESERAFLTDVRAETVDLFFVLNKIDYLGEAERAEAIAFTERVVADALGRETKVYALSARAALEAKVADDPAAFEASGFAAFEGDFRAALLRDKGRLVLESVGSRAAALCADEANAIAVQERALELPADALATAQERMRAVFADARRVRADLRPLFKADTDRLVARVELDLETLRTRAEARLHAVVTDFLASDAEVRRSGDRLRELTEDALREEVDRWRREEDRALAEDFRATASRFVEGADAAAGEAVRLCGEVLDLELTATSVARDLSPETRFSFSFFEIPTIIESLLPDMRRLLPTAMARKRLERETRARIPRIVDQHCGRLRWDFVRRLERSRLQLERDLDAQLDATLDGLSRGLERAETDREAGEDAASDLRARPCLARPPRKAPLEVRRARVLGDDVSAPDVSLEVLRALGDTTVAADEVEVPIPDLQPEEGAADVFQLRIGLYDLLVERGLASCMDDAERERFLRTALGELLAAEPALRFALSERSRKTEELERAARMRGRQNALTGEWLIPRLEQEIVLYDARVRALDRTIQGAGR